jgi:hypothetical protein
MCVGFSGCTGSGVSSLSETTAKYLGVDYIRDIRQDYLREHLIIENSLTDRQVLKMYIDLLGRKKSMERSLTKFVSDLTTMDYSSYILSKMSDNDELQYQILSYIRECAIHAAQCYDVIFLTPYPEGTKRPAWNAMVQLLTEKSVEDGSPIFLVHHIMSLSESDQIPEILEVCDKISEVKVKTESIRTGIKPVGTDMTQ